MRQAKIEVESSSTGGLLDGSWNAFWDTKNGVFLFFLNVFFFFFAFLLPCFFSGNDPKLTCADFFKRVVQPPPSFWIAFKLLLQILTPALPQRPPIHIKLFLQFQLPC